MKSFFVRSLQYLEESFSIPEDLSTFQDYSFLRNETFSLKRGLISPTEEIFGGPCYIVAFSKKGLKILLH